MKNLPKSIEIRLSNNSVNEEMFKEAAGPYNAALKENGHNYTLKLRRITTDMKIAKLTQERKHIMKQSQSILDAKKEGKTQEQGK